MEQVKFVLLILCVQTAEGFIWTSNTTSNSVCVGNIISLAWAYTLELGEIQQLTSWTKYDEGRLICVADSFGGLSPAEGYVGRLTRIENAGIQISNATSSDKGTYIVIVTLISGIEYRMNATVHVHEIANASCIPTCDSSLKCQIPPACPVKNGIHAVWTVEGVKYPNVFPYTSCNYDRSSIVCAEGDAVTACYSGPSLCIGYACKITDSSIRTSTIAGIVSSIRTSSIDGIVSSIRTSSIDGIVSSIRTSSIGGIVSSIRTSSIDGIVSSIRTSSIAVIAGAVSGGIGIIVIVSIIIFFWRRHRLPKTNNQDKRDFRHWVIHFPGQLKVT